MSTETKPENSEKRQEALKRHCAGCYDNVYNQGCGGAKRCWGLRTMFLTQRKRVHISQRPPWTQKAEKLPSCYHVPQYVFVDANRTN